MKKLNQNQKYIILSAIPLNNAANNYDFSPITGKQFIELKKGGLFADGINYLPSNISNIKVNNYNDKLDDFYTKIKDFYSDPKKYSAKIKNKIKTKIEHKVSSFKSKFIKLKNVFTSYLTRDKDSIEKQELSTIEKTYSPTKKYTWKRALQKEISALNKYTSLYSNKIRERFENSVLYTTSTLEDNIEMQEQSIIERSGQNNISQRLTRQLIFSKKTIINKGLENKLNSLVKNGTKFNDVEEYVNSLGMNISRSTYYRIRKRNNYFAN